MLQRSATEKIAAHIEWLRLVILNDGWYLEYECCQRIKRKPNQSPAIIVIYKEIRFVFSPCGIYATHGLRIGLMRSVSETKLLLRLCFGGS